VHVKIKSKYIWKPKRKFRKKCNTVR